MYRFFYLPPRIHNKGDAIRSRGSLPVKPRRGHPTQGHEVKKAAGTYGHSSWDLSLKKQLQWLKDKPKRTGLGEKLPEGKELAWVLLFQSGKQSRLLKSYL